ncbi:PASTA domain-containing protein [Streptomyces sp. SID5785]|uniref:PASTA domain-containing protein n=1 Tax=Streptomyces sp. SID5785 TaxID=2690309 RepID=UPI0013610CA7|nr:PASTA domain-containing protein [Streptomyces sp. SID5785]MZD10553.1 PASTA domain-containing protein [Streptomyces sp. SID5785]
MKLRPMARGVALTIAAAVVAVGCSDSSTGASDEQHAATGTHAGSASLPPDSLPVKVKSEVEKGLGYSLQDATDLGRTVDPEHLDRWRFCLSREDEGAQAVDLGAVPYGEKCPTHWDAHVPVPKTPDVTGQDFEKAYDALLSKGYDGRSIEVFYGSSAATAHQDLARVHGEVCKQTPRPGRDFDADENVKLYVAEGTCPEQ